MERTSISRYRKTRAELMEILFLRLTAKNLDQLAVMKQGRNSNGAPRPLKYLLDLSHAEPFLVDHLLFKL